MRYVWSGVLALSLVLAVAPTASAAMLVKTDRLGYHGAVAYFGNDAGARDRAITGDDPLQVVGIPDRDASLYFSYNYTTGQVNVDFVNANIFTVPTFYTTKLNTNGQPIDSPDGDWFYSGTKHNPQFHVGEDNGNPNLSRTGRVQLYDNNGSTDEFFDASFTDLSGGFYTTLNFTAHSSTTSLTDFGGGNKIDDLTRLWTGTDETVSGKNFGDFLFWTINIQFQGLAGVESGGVVTANDHPDAVVGTFYAIFHNTNTVTPSLNGYYAVALDFNMTNWAFAQGNAALNGNFNASKFIAPVFVPPVDDPGDEGGESLPGGGPVHLPVPGAVEMGMVLMCGTAAFKRWRTSRRA